MFRTDVIYIGGWLLYRTFEDGNLMAEYMEKYDTRHGMKEVIDDIRGAAAMGLSDGAVPQTGDGEALQFGANG